MNIFFYTSSAEPNSFPKVLGEAIRYQGELRDECDILNPVLTIEGLNPDTTFNYCYIPDFNRYYFITESSVVRTGLMDFMLHVDVLQSWSSNILQQEAYIARNEYEYDMMLIDEIPIVKPDNKFSYVESTSDQIRNTFSMELGYNYIVTNGYYTTEKYAKRNED
nr:MAG TPA: hypothetical protein [Caudoviricetes sp.]